MRLSLMLRLTACAFFGLALVAGCGGNSSPFTEGEGGEASGAESSGGASGTGTNGGTGGASGSATGGAGGSSGASGEGGTASGGVSTGGSATGGNETGGNETGGSETGGMDAGGTGGAEGGAAGLGGIGARAGASGSTSTGGSAGATTTDPKCPVREPAAGSMCTQVGLRCPYDASGCRCLLVQNNQCFQLDTTCFAVDTGGADRIAAPPAHYCTCAAIPDRPTPGWNCAPLPQ
jgi:hypothetical protein